MSGLTPCRVSLGGDTVYRLTHRPLGADSPRTDGLVLVAFREPSSPVARVGLER